MFLIKTNKPLGFVFLERTREKTVGPGPWGEMGQEQLVLQEGQRLSVQAKRVESVHPDGRAPQEAGPALQV